MLQISCSGSPYEIGFKHGRAATAEVSRSITFYAALFQRKASLNWQKVRDLALKFEATIKEKWPLYQEEMKGTYSAAICGNYTTPSKESSLTSTTGVADGAGVELSDIIALNVRTEIAFGLFSDGCTALSWTTEKTTFLAQNWDWETEQKENVIVLTIAQAHKPTIKTVTEAGIIGKIGLNSAGVGVCLNAIRAAGVDMERLPCHLGLRMALESESLAHAVSSLTKYGVASSCHMLVADATGSIGLEWSSVDLQKVEMNASRQVFHTNHFLVPHEGIKDTVLLEDSPFRVSRVEELAMQIKHEPSLQDITGIFKDEANQPRAICRSESDSSSLVTVFNIAMDLEVPCALVKLGKPISPDEEVELSF